MHLNTEVQEILVEGKRVTGVRLADGTVHQADAVVSNADVAWTYLNLIPAQYRRKNSDRWVKSKKYSMSLFVIYFGTKKRYNTGDRSWRITTSSSASATRGCCATSSPTRTCRRTSRSTCTCRP